MGIQNLASESRAWAVMRAIVLVYDHMLYYSCDNENILFCYQR